MPESPLNTIAVIGGGLAGLAAAEAASRHGLRVELFEQAATLGGRAGSFVEPFADELVDFSQHAAMGCCTNFLDFCRRTGVADCFRRENRLNFLGPDNELHRFAPSRWLPAPFHLGAGLQSLTFLTARERREIARAIRALARVREREAPAEPQLRRDITPRPSARREPRPPEPTQLRPETVFGDWLQRERQSENAVRHFWSVIIHGALSETVENVSLSAARKVFVDSLLASRGAGDLILPNEPLGAILDLSVARSLTDRGIALHRGTRAMWVESGDDGELSLVLAEGDARLFDAVVLAVPWHRAAGLFPPSLLDDLPALVSAQELSSGAIAAVHLWFDRPVTPLPHSVLVGKLAQWIFRPGRVRARTHAGDDAVDDSGAACVQARTLPDAAYFQVLISAAHRLAPADKNALLAQVCEEIAAAFPETKNAALLHSRVVVQPQAVFSMRPGASALRPPQATPIANLFLAGDWTATGWPATMEGAVRSGYLAVEALLRSAGRPHSILVPDLPRGFLASRIIS
jgi:squalene-associated FAD-dependent desaturase